MFNIYILIITSFTISFSFSCNDISNYKKINYTTNIKPVSGSRCSKACVWSSYAFFINAQKPDAVCDTGPCACVYKYNIYKKCKSNIKSKVKLNYLMDVPSYYKYLAFKTKNSYDKNKFKKALYVSGNSEYVYNLIREISNL